MSVAAHEEPQGASEPPLLLRNQNQPRPCPWSANRDLSVFPSPWELLGAQDATTGSFGLGQLKLEQPEISISRAVYKSAQIPCKVSSGTFSSDYIHWYRQKPDQSMEHLMYVSSTATVCGKNSKFKASKYTQTSTSTLTINFLEKEDEAVYFCACWTGIHSVRITCTRTISRSVPTHILLNMGNPRGCTARPQSEPPSPQHLSCTFLFVTSCWEPGT
ncbi:T-cell receptor gamma chain V region 5/10-13 [Myotis davidii]|nr:T-cell receptor gamma chain V region 5/10-13 [Myotis davidii]